MDPLAAVDLNLLVLFRALYEERTVARAARRVALSPSAASHALGRLREAFGDPLFERSGPHMVPTARAEALADAVGRALSELRGTLATPAAFDPERASGPFHVAAVDLAQVTLVPRLVTHLAERAPNVRVVASRPTEDPARGLAEGTLDLVLGGVGDDANLRRQALGSHPFACVVRADHPAVRDGLTPARYASLGHVLVSPRSAGRGHVDDALAALGLTRRVVYVTPQSLSAAMVVARSDLVLTTAVGMARLAARLLPLAVLEPPVPIAPYVLWSAWHARRDADPLHTWVRQEIARLATDAE